MNYSKVLSKIIVSGLCGYLLMFLTIYLIVFHNFGGEIYDIIPGSLSSSVLYSIIALVFGGMLGFLIMSYFLKQKIYIKNYIFTFLLSIIIIILLYNFETFPYYTIELFIPSLILTITEFYTGKLKHE